MGKVFISFLGIGNPRDEPGYKELAYEFSHSTTITTKFSQRAIIEKCGATSFDKIYILMTEESEQKHWSLLQTELQELGIPKHAIHGSASLSANQQTEEDQWSWFESLLGLINDGDEVVFDFTHGFRSVPIIFSTAISFLQKVRQFQLLHAYYGYMDDSKALTGRMIDMARFYQINQWADGVQALIRTADTGPLVELASDSNTKLASIGDTKLTIALTELTSAIKDVDINGVEARTRNALEVVHQNLGSASYTERLLLTMIEEKFSVLAEKKSSGRYDAPFFSNQLQLVHTLLSHQMHMQAFTVMRELIVSIGVLGAKQKYLNAARVSKKKQRGARNYGTRFFAHMVGVDLQRIQYDNGHAEEQRAVLRQYCTLLHPLGVLPSLRETSTTIKNLRNGLSHGWTGTPTAEIDLHHKAQECYEELCAIIKIVEEAGLMRD